MPLFISYHYCPIKPEIQKFVLILLKLQPMKSEFGFYYEKFHCISLHINILRELIKFKWDTSDIVYQNL